MGGCHHSLLHRRILHEYFEDISLSKSKEVFYDNSGIIYSIFLYTKKGYSLEVPR